MKKLFATMLVSLMGLGVFGMAMQPMVEAEAVKIPGFDVSYNGGNVSVESETNQDTAWETLFNKYKGFVLAFSGIAAISMVGVFIMHFLKLGASAGNPNARSQATTGILWSGIAAALLGSVALITGIFYNAIGTGVDTP